VQAARAKAEELMQNAIENELAAKGQLDMEQQRLGQVEDDIDRERDKVRRIVADAQSTPPSLLRLAHPGCRAGPAGAGRA
jgi:hypothetical protein